MATYTRAQLINEALVALGVAAANQTPQIDEIERIDTAIPGIIQTARDAEIFYIGDVDNISEGQFKPLADYVAWECHNKFGVTGDDLQNLLTARNEAVLKLKVMARGRPTYAPLKNDFL